MKKLLTAICLLLTIVISIPMFTACGSKPATAKSVTLCNFEQWGPDFLTMRLGSYFGIIEQYEKQDENDVFVKNGRYSAQMRPLGRPIQDIRPSMYFPTVIHSEKFDFDYHDFTAIDNVGLSVYLDREESFTMRVSLVVGVSSPNGYNTTDETEFVLQGKTWNEIKYSIDHAKLGKVYDITNVYGVAISFPYEPDENIENSPYLYVDDVVLNFRTSKASYNAKINLEDREITDFENPDYYPYFKAYRPFGTYSESEAGVVPANAYSFLGKTGHVYRLTTTPGDYSRRLSSNFVIKEKFMKNTSMSKVERGLLTKYCLSFDIYMQSETDEDFLIFVYQHSKENKTSGSQFYYIKANEWTNVTVKFQTFGSKQVGEPGDLVVRFLEYTTEQYGNLSFFMDNFCIVLND